MLRGSDDADDAEQLQRSLRHEAGSDRPAATMARASRPPPRPKQRPEPAPLSTEDLQRMVMAPAPPPPRRASRPAPTPQPAPTPPPPLAEQRIAVEPAAATSHQAERESMMLRAIDVLQQRIGKARPPWKSYSVLGLVVVACVLSLVALGLDFHLLGVQAELKANSDESAARLGRMEGFVSAPLAARGAPDRMATTTRPAPEDARIMITFQVPNPAPSAEYSDSVVVSLRQLVLDEADEKAAAAALRPGVLVRFLGLCCTLPDTENTTRSGKPQLRCDADNAVIDQIEMTLTFARAFVGRSCSALIFFG